MKLGPNLFCDFLFPILTKQRLEGDMDRRKERVGILGASEVTDGRRADDKGIYEFLKTT